MKKRRETARFSVTGPGVLSVRSSELIKTEAFHRQLKALEKLIDNGGTFLGCDFSQLRNKK